MRQLLPLVLAASSLFAVDAQPLPAPATVPAPQAGGPLVQPPLPRADASKEQREVDAQWRAIREKAVQDPELVAARKAVEDAQKAYRAKEEEVMAKDPAYAEVKAKREAIRASRMQPRPEPAVGGQPPAPAPNSVPPPNPIPAPAPVAPAPNPVPAH